jgi:4,5-DOPA dioxygenase extradiol
MEGEHMSTGKLPTLFVSHGAPTMAIEPIPAHEFLTGLGEQYSTVDSVLFVSAHWATSQPAVSAAEKPDTIHDFSGFPNELYDISYPAPGAPSLAIRVAEMLRGTGSECDIEPLRGLDHGAWVPSMLMFPGADVPIAQLSIRNDLDPSAHLAAGRSIERLREENVLVIGSGGAVHPLGYGPLGPGVPTSDWAVQFNDWLRTAVEVGDVEALVDYQSRAPYPQRAHPYPDHYMPLLVAFGAAGEGAKGVVLHDSWYWGNLGLAAYRFE